MKKFYLTIITTIAVIQLSFAQWTTSGTNIYNSNTGNVGIATTVPPARFSVSPVSTSLTNQATIFSAGDNLATLGSTGGSYLYPFEFQYDAPNNTRLQIAPYRRVPGTDWGGTAYRLQFAVDNSYTNGSKAYIEIGGSDPTAVYGGFISLATAGTDRLCVLNNGNVLIGKTMQSNTSYILDVAGNARANEIVVNASGADFVFDPAYKLPSLSRLEKYIRYNHHLPEIAPAKQMQAEGLNVGENETKLLQKVEELTLYTIASDKQIKEEHAMIAQQQALLLQFQQLIKNQQKEIDELKNKH